MQGYTVCDLCGAINAVDREPAPSRWECDNCVSTSAWFFPLRNRNAAETHAAHIASRYQEVAATREP